MTIRHDKSRHMILAERPIDLAREWYRLKGYTPGKPCPEDSASWSHWDGGETASQGLHRALNGDLSAYERARAWIDRCTFAPLTRSVEMVAAPFGVPIVGEYLAGEPDCCRTIISEPKASAPLRIVVDNGSSSAIPADKLLERACAILGLVLGLQSIRPVELWLGDFNRSNVPVPGTGGSTGPDKVLAATTLTALDLQGDSLGTTVYALTSTAYTRRFGYEVCSMHGHRVAWPNFNACRQFGGGQGASDADSAQPSYREGMRWLTGSGPEDVMIPGASTKSMVPFADPAKWVETMLAKIQEDALK